MPGSALGPKLSIDDLNMKDKNVIVRVDFNVPMKDGAILDDFRIKSAIPTLAKINESGGRCCPVLGCNPKQKTMKISEVPMDPPPPLCDSKALVRSTVGVVAATFGTMSYFALYECPPPPPRPIVRATVGVVSAKFCALVVLSQGEGGANPWLLAPMIEACRSAPQGEKHATALGALSAYPLQVATTHKAMECFNPELLQTPQMPSHSGIPKCILGVSRKEWERRTPADTMCRFAIMYFDTMDKKQRKRTHRQMHCFGCYTLLPWTPWIHGMA